MRVRFEYCRFDQSSGFVMKYYQGSKLAGLGQEYPRSLNFVMLCTLRGYRLCRTLQRYCEVSGMRLFPLTGGVAGFHHMPGTLHSRRTRRLCKDALASVVFV
jgi:hypothetical protein